MALEMRGSCERCGTPVKQRELSQWYFKVTEYAQRLLDDMDGLEGKWPERVLLMHGLGTEDDPVFPGMHEAAAMVTGATLAAARAVWTSAAQHGASIAGGLHHAMAGSASGFCVYDDPAVYAKSSPITFIKNVKTPTMVMVGEEDYRTPVSESAK